MSFKFTSQKLLNGLFEPEGIYLAPPAEGELRALQVFGENAAFYRQWNYNGVPLKGHVGIDLRVAAGATLLAVDSGRVIEISQERGGFERYIKLEHRWGESFYANCGDVLVETGQSVAGGEAIARALTSAEILPVSRSAADAGTPAPHPPTSRAATRIAQTLTPDPSGIWFHFGVRIAPFNRYDGWGGFADPLPYLPTGAIIMPESAIDAPIESPADAPTDAPADASLEISLEASTAGRGGSAGRWRSDFVPHPMAADAPGQRRP